MNIKNNNMLVFSKLIYKYLQFKYYLISSYIKKKK